MRCDEVMKTRVEFLRQDDSAAEAARRMRDRNLGFLPVCDDAGRPVGTITDRDLALRVLGANLDGTARIGDLMSPDVVACRGSDEIAEAEHLMATHHKSRIMVLDPKGRLAGVISLSDLAERDARRALQTLREVSVREARA